MRRGDTVDIGSFCARVMWPFESVDGEGNEDSLVLLLSYVQEGKGLRILLTGDAELDQEREFVQEVGDIDVLKLGHHGSKVSVDGELLDVLKPELSLASAGEGNRYGHPSDACIDAVKEAGGVFACTIEHGDASDRDDVVGVWWAPGLEWHGTNAKACGRGAQCPKPVCCRHI